MSYLRTRLVSSYLSLSAANSTKGSVRGRKEGRNAPSTGARKEGRSVPFLGLDAIGSQTQDIQSPIAHQTIVRTSRHCDS